MPGFQENRNSCPEINQIRKNATKQQCTGLEIRFKDTELKQYDLKKDTITLKQYLQIFHPKIASVYHVTGSGDYYMESRDRN